MEVENYKRLVRLYIPDADFQQGEKYSLPEGQAHYLRNVMRKSAGDALRVFNGRAGEWLARIAEINKKNAIIELDHQLLEQEQSADIWVLASPVKKEAFDLMVEKACELGAAKFIPIISDHTVIHKVNQERLQAIAIEAAEQSERLDIMAIEPLVDLKTFLNSNHYDRNLIFCIEREKAEPLINVAQKLRKKSLSILIGPEGGFSSQEIDFISHLKYVSTASLGPRILKAETALITALSAVQLINEVPLA